MGPLLSMTAFIGGAIIAFLFLNALLSYAGRGRYPRESSDFRMLIACLSGVITLFAIQIAMSLEKP